MKPVRIAGAIALVAMASLVTVDAQDKQTKEAQEAAAKEAKDAREVADAIAAFKTDPDLAKWFTTAHGYVVFPSITKAALIVGGAGGGGRVFEKGAYIGNANVSQASIGAQVGGQTFSEVIFFETPAALARFKENKFEWAAGMSAVAAASGKTKDAKYTDGVAVFTRGEKGLMAEVSVGGQKFKFTPKK